MIAAIANLIKDWVKKQTRMFAPGIRLVALVKPNNVVKNVYSKGLPESTVTLLKHFVDDLDPKPKVESGNRKVSCNDS